MIKYKIINDFLNKKDFIKLITRIFPVPVGSPRTDNISWEFANVQVEDVLSKEDRFAKMTNIKLTNQINSWALFHYFMVGHSQNQTLECIDPLLFKINPLAFYRIQANLTAQQEKTTRSPFHIDYGTEPLEHTSMLTSIYYMNTTNGPTILEDGTEIESRANRLVTFPSGTFHAGTMCTDQPYRIVINFNYFKDLELP